MHEHDIFAQSLMMRSPQQQRTKPQPSSLASKFKAAKAPLAHRCTRTKRDMSMTTVAGQTHHNS